MKFSAVILRIAALIPFGVSVLWFDRNNVFSDQFGVATPAFHIATLARIVVVAYVAIAMASIGRLLLRRVGGADIKGADGFLAASVLGGGTTVAVVYALGLSGLLYRWVLALLVMGIVFCSAPVLPGFNWSRLRYQVMEAFRERYFMALLLAGFAAEIAYLSLWKGLVSPSGYGDVVSHYIPYYTSVIRQHGTTINEFYWHFYEMKGASFHFLATALADVQAIQLLVFYLCCIAAVALYQTVQRIGGATSFGLLAAAIFLGSSLVIDTDFQKNHMPIGVFVILSFYFGQLLFDEKQQNARPLAWVFCVAVGTVSLLQIEASAFIAVLLASFAAATLVFRQYRVLPILGAAMLAVIFLVTASMAYNYATTGMYHIYPMSLFMKHGDETRFLHHFSLTDAVYMMDFAGSSHPVGGSRLADSYANGGIVGIIALLAGEVTSLPMVVGVGVAVMAVAVRARLNGAERVFGSYAFIAVTAVAFALILAMTDGSLGTLRDIVEIAIAPLEFRKVEGFAFIIPGLLAIMLLLQPIGTRQARAALIAAIFFSLGIGSIIVFNGSGKTSYGEVPIERMTAFLSFFQTLFFVATVIFITDIWARLRPGSLVAIKGVSALGMLLLPVAIITIRLHHTGWHSSLLMPYLKGQAGYSQIYKNLGGEWAESVRHHIPAQSIVIGLNVCWVCESLPNMRWQAPIWNVYSEKMSDVWYGPPEVAAKILKDRQVSHIVVNTSEPLWIHANAPLFSPEAMGRFFKVSWVSPDRKSYILTWRNGDAGNDPSMSAFLTDYRRRLNSDGKSDYHRDYMAIALDGRERYGSQWVWGINE